VVGPCVCVPHSLVRGAQEEHAKYKKCNHGGEGGRAVRVGRHQEPVVLVVLVRPQGDGLFRVQHAVASASVQHAELEDAVVVRGGEGGAELARGVSAQRLPHMRVQHHELQLHVVRGPPALLLLPLLHHQAVVGELLVDAVQQLHVRMCTRLQVISAPPCFKMRLI